MKSSIRRFWPALLLAISCAVPYASAGTTSVDITSAGNFAYDGVYISPYYATVGTTTNTTIICDDFADESNLNQPFTATVTTFSNLASSLGSTVWGAYELTQGKTSTAIVQLYEQAAWLAIQMLGQSPNSTAKAYYSYAVWAVFDPAGVKAWLAGDPNAYNCIFGSSCSYGLNGAGLLASAQQNYLNGNYSNWALLSPLAPSGSVCSPKISGNGTCPEQEFFVQVAEGGAAALYLLLAAATCFGVMFIRSRRLNTATQIA
jgi:hypothetical protein